MVIISFRILQIFYHPKNVAGFANWAISILFFSAHRSKHRWKSVVGTITMKDVKLMLNT